MASCLPRRDLLAAAAAAALALCALSAVAADVKPAHGPSFDTRGWYFLWVNHNKGERAGTGASRHPVG